ncbi:MAG: four helix bundle protein [Candidatus Shapirobacteria bacterium]|nr:four helix bundle protein [Candidatus Shapirobacteria bacterium]MDD4410521.1 four helix bundle protein [Candidatus Shapirobacteria bacterium]
MNFTDLNIWKEANKLAISIYKITQTFPKSEIFGIISQLQRASTSISANIAEGFGRKGNKEFIQFLYQSKGSLYETQNFILFSQDIGYIEKSQAKALLDQYESLAKMLNSFITKVKYNNDQ